MAKVPPTLSDAEVMDDSDGPPNSKRNRTVTNKPPDQPSSSEDLSECDDDDDDDMDDIGGNVYFQKRQRQASQCKGMYQIGREGKGSQGSDEVAGNCKGNDKGNYKGTLISKDDDIFYRFSQKRWDDDKQRARALLAYCERTSSDDKCECTDIQKRQMFNEKAKFPGKWIPVRCQRCDNYLPAEFLENVVLVPLVMTDTQVPIVIERDAVAKVLQRCCLFNLSSKLRSLGEKLDASINVTRASEVECQTRIAKVGENVTKLDAGMVQLKGNQHCLSVQIGQLVNMMARMDRRWAREEAREEAERAVQGDVVERAVQGDD
jgi:hypothetical protein